MIGESNLDILLKNINPILHKDSYVFLTFSKKLENKENSIMIFKEKEGTTMIIKEEFVLFNP